MCSKWDYAIVFVFLHKAAWMCSSRYTTFTHKFNTMRCLVLHRILMRRCEFRIIGIFSLENLFWFQVTCKMSIWRLSVEVLVFSRYNIKMMKNHFDHGFLLFQKWSDLHLAVFGTRKNNREKCSYNKSRLKTYMPTKNLHDIFSHHKSTPKSTLKSASI